MSQQPLVARRLAVVPTLRCTLNCKLCCNHMNRFKHPYDIPIDKLKQDIDRLFELFDYIKWIQFVGGEIFIRDDMAEVYEYTLKYKSKFDKLILMTNATIAPRPAEIEVLKKAWEICDIGYKAVLDSDIVGLTEIQAAAIGEKAARDAGAESITFTIFASGERTNTVIGRPTEKIIEAGDMIMYALADEWPFVAGGNPSPKQQQLIHDLIVAEDIGIKAITPGVKAGKVIKEIRDYFNERGLSENDLYPPIHGNGLEEAESPYPDENSTYAFEKGMGINFDVSLFGVEGVGSNRIEEGFIIGEEGLITLSPLISGLRESYLKKYRK